MASTTPRALLKEQYVSLAKSLPDRLQRFFARYPPNEILKPSQRGKPHTGYQMDSKNPFEAQRHPETGRLHNPVYSLRRQADLVKLAREHGVEELLPHTIKKTDVRLAKRVELGWRGKGTGVGQKVKGHIHERQLAAKMDKRREAMLNMPALIREWKAVGRKNWTKWPK